MTLNGLVSKTTALVYAGNLSAILGLGKFLIFAVLVVASLALGLLTWIPLFNYSYHYWMDK